ncbi:GNAT family N-acetyltransferase [Aeromicrobium sp. Leaf350]|uniref:GNAT family N-acetyltransferase n=1 Tax=Aeromicrobium sp. Leaf350 TaxID=2876565 RepID=UPI001E5D1E4C|nr:GNAT family N-acetyltransferase [Aeromicrobium sp. Leaf350]
MSVHVRLAEPGDDEALVDVDDATWGPWSSPVERPDRATRSSFVDPDDDRTEHLVAVVDDAVVGYVGLRAVGPSPSHDHVLQISGFGVTPSAQGRGVGRALVEAALERARGRGARKVTLAVLGHNAVARRLYERCGFEVEGVLRAEYRLGGADVDDVLMARRLEQG